MDLRIAGRTALVTASSKGLGLACATALAADGANVAITGRDPVVLEAAAQRLRASTGAQVLSVPGDITEPAEPARAVAATVERFGALEILVPNAGGPPPGRALDVTDEQLEGALNANLLTSVRLVLEALPHLRAAGWGRICCITSATVVQPSPTLALSNTARTALRAWAKTAATDLADAGITLNLACPGLHRTDRTRQLGSSGRFGDPAGFGQAVAFLCSDGAAFVTGTTLVVDGGATSGI